ncbi:hypothetical protein BpHYR1_041518 [Brachionus plicatilis]|uniref:Uncharacterized protein n=1 Tax=Brachionus plicatilis TaxID=10195 RepID=A0A3M7S478_BRAPC|nr:hypothetical protein BpHYR1_041518 [Brachionus plicatilis]
METKLIRALLYTSQCPIEKSPYNYSNICKENVKTAFRKNLMKNSKNFLSNNSKSVSFLPFVLAMIQILPNSEIKFMMKVKNIFKFNFPYFSITFPRLDLYLLFHSLKVAAWNCKKFMRLCSYLTNNFFVVSDTVYYVLLVY